MKKPEYHLCIIGPIDRVKLDESHPRGEGYIRRCTQEAFEKIAGHSEETCASGWGVTPKRLDDIRFAWHSDEVKKYLIKSYIDEGKKFPSKLYEAYYLLLKKNGEI